MSDITSTNDTSTPEHVPVTPDEEVTTQHLLSAILSIQRMVEEQRKFSLDQRKVNAKQESFNTNMLSYIEGVEADTDETAEDTTNSIPAAAVVEREEEKERKSDSSTHQRRSRAVRDSRKSVIVANSNNSTMYTGDLLSPEPAPPARTVQTEAERARRESRLFSTPAHSPINPAPATSVRPKRSLPAVDKSRHSKYYEANQALAKIDKFYGDRKNDKDIDVYMFVRGIDFQLDRWMQDEVFGRLELVISCTGGAAQMWLLNKRDDLLVMWSIGTITAEMTEWEYVKVDFIESMGGGQTQRLYQTKLEGLRLGKGGDGEELTKFITKFTDWAMRAYPLNKYPDTKARSLMLGAMFESRVRESDWGIWGTMMRSQPRPEMLEDLEAALTSAWSVEQTIRAHRSKKYPDNAGGGKNKGGFNAATPSSHTLQSMEVGGETDEGGRGEGVAETGESLNAAATKRPSNGAAPKRALNKHIDGKTAAQLIKLNRCLHCYGTDHYARDCTSPANRPPKDSELKA